MLNNKKILFILKKRSSYGVSYGLANSCRFVANALEKEGAKTKIVEVVDNNAIDREVYNYKPTHVVIEALWVVPEKFTILCSKYPNIKWSVRIHSKTPFIAMEGIAIQWLSQYQTMIIDNFPNFTIGSNALITSNELNDLGIENFYLPNVYFPNVELGEIDETPIPDKTVINVGCFGSIRPLKNHLQQATAAVLFAKQINKKLRFHINANRIEQKGEPILKNLENLFAYSGQELVKHDWMSHTDFLKLVSTMDLGLQVSFSETFNIVAADFVYQNVPIIGSYDIEWLSNYYKANATDYTDIVQKLKNAYTLKSYGVHWINKIKLWNHNRTSTDKWVKFLKIVG